MTDMSKFANTHPAPLFYTPVTPLSLTTCTLLITKSGIRTTSFDAFQTIKWQLFANFSESSAFGEILPASSRSAFQGICITGSG